MGYLGMRPHGNGYSLWFGVCFVILGCFSESS